MVEFKIVMSTKDGKSYQEDIKEASADYFLNKKIGETVQGDNFGHPGLEAKITGGSDNAGFPMRKDVDGPTRRQILAVQGVGLKKKRHGQRQRKTVTGNIIGTDIVQINLKVLKEGKTKLAGEPEPEATPEKKEEEKPKTEEKKE
jgi:small subunit ribosomal protein S6e